jgi:cyclic beta-1,2-glucan synthetase
VQVSKKIRDTMFLLWRGWWRSNGLAYDSASNEPPLRAALLSADQMAKYGKTLAGSHTLGLERAPDRLLTRLAENEGILIGACHLLTEALTADRRITPAGEWLLDNFYLIEEQMRTARRHLPKRYSRGLPRLASGPSWGA